MPAIPKTDDVNKVREQATQALGEAIEQTTPYHAWRPVFRALFGLADLEEPSIARQRILDQLAADPGPPRAGSLDRAELDFDVLFAQVVGGLLRRSRPDEAQVAVARPDRIEGGDRDA